MNRFKRGLACGVLSVGLVLLVGCGEGGSGIKTQSVDAKVEAELYKLAHMNGCLDCHSVTAAVIGPSWIDIAKRYRESPIASAREVLVESVKNGSKGNWVVWKTTEGMPPLGKRVSEEHIVKLVEFILSLDRAPGVDAPPAAAAAK